MEKNSSFEAGTKNKQSTKMKKAALIAVAVAFIPAAYFMTIVASGNFHAVTPREAYRSAQPNYAQLEYYAKTFGIKSDINLRGKNAGSRWYRDEVRACAALGIKHYDVGLSASSEPTARQVRKLIEIMRTAPRPVLMHCKSGADRSGLLAAMWKMYVDGATRAEADSELSVRYGHVPLLGTSAMDHFFMAWRPSEAVAK